MAHFSLLTLWKLDAPIGHVWDALHDTASWPRWWRYVACVTPLAPGAANGEGGRWQLVWRTALCYSLVFEACVVRVQPPHRLDAETRGEGRVRGFGADAMTQARLTLTLTPSTRSSAPFTRSRRAARIAIAASSATAWRRTGRFTVASTARSIRA